MPISNWAIVRHIAVTTREEAEQALDANRLFVRTYRQGKPGNLWRCRRNGRTQTWKTRPDDFRIPVKAGLKECGSIRPENLDEFFVETTDAMVE